MQDRTVHQLELNNVHNEAVRAGMPAPLSALTQRMMQNRIQYNQRKTGLDAQQWAQLNQKVVNQLGTNAAKPVLSAGAVNVSAPTFDQQVARAMEPYTLTGGAITSEPVPEPSHMAYNPFIHRSDDLESESSGSDDDEDSTIEQDNYNYALGGGGRRKKKSRGSKKNWRRKMLAHETMSRVTTGRRSSPVY